MKLKTGPTRRVHANNTRGAAFCGLGAFVGVGKTQRAHVYTAAILPVGPDDYKKIDAEKLAGELEVDKCAVNSGRFWMMDEVDYASGDTVDFHGVKMNWAGDMTGAEMIAQFQSAYVPSLIQRNTNWVFHKGKPVHLLRDPDGTVWVLQEYTKAVDASLTPDNLDQLGGKLKNLPRAGSSKRRCSPRTCRLIRIALAAGQLSFAMILVTPTRGAAMARTPVPTTCRREETVKALPIIPKRSESLLPTAAKDNRMT